MKNSPNFRVFIIVLLVLLALASAFTGAAAQESSSAATPAGPTATPTVIAPTPALIITAVQPNTVANSSSTEIVITGSGFADGAIVILGNNGSLATTFVSSNLLRALVPAGTPGGVYAVQVVNPDASSASLPNALTITAPANPTATPNATNTPAPTAYVRPLLVVSSYGASSAEIIPNTDLDFEMTLTNAGGTRATNIVATFISGDFVARVTGGVHALGNLETGQANRFWQPLHAGEGLPNGGIATLPVKVDYTDVNGTPYSETFNLTFPVRRLASGPAATATATPTTTPTATATATLGPRLRPQLIVTSYDSSVLQLQPGMTFTLSLNVQNQGNAAAERITLIVGGGTATGGAISGTPVPGGVSGADGEFSKFAPLGASNVQTLGDLAVGADLKATMQFVVNAATDPGAYPLKVSFVYEDAQNSEYVDDQIVTLLVVRRPSVNVSFYAPLPPFFAGEPGSLPLQVVNTGNRSAVLGNFTVSADNATIENGTVFVGNLEPGGFYPLDALIIPGAEGTQELVLTVSYTDDFGQPQTITQSLAIDVMPAMVFEEPTDIIDEPGPVEPVEETLGQKIWRFFLGLIGLSSGPPQGNVDSGVPFEGQPSEFPPGEGVPLP